MTELLNLRCPTCGATLSVAGELNKFGCRHCGNQYLFDRQLQDLSAGERDSVRPTVTYTNKSKQWLRVAEYEIFLHGLTEATIDKKRVLYADVAFRNASNAPLKCRYDQWVIFDREGYTYDALRDFDDRAIYEGQSRRYLGMTRVITPGMQLRGWLGYLVPARATIDYFQFAGGDPLKTVEFRLQLAHE
jgi:predicted  nucleic acid-binding Zn-ribbon protein